MRKTENRTREWMEHGAGKGLLFPAVLAVGIWMLVPFLQARVGPQAAGLKALVVTTGQNTHDWKTSSAALRRILENTGLFSVDMAVSPPEGEETAGFRPRFSSYDLVVLDYNGREWPEETREAFEAFVRSGGGVVVFHSAGSAFPEWKEYRRIVGLGGWSDPGGDIGPCVYWEGREVVRDTAPGASGRSSEPHPFAVVTRDASHPVTRGLPARWMHARDEITGLLRGPAENIRILATAYSDPVRVGTGRHEPVLFTVAYGKGRVFHTVLGHTDGNPSPALECAGFIVTFQRGAEWAATGEVTQEVPAQFPALLRKEPTPDDVRRWKDFRPPNLDEILARLSSYTYGLDEEPLAELRDYVRALRHVPEAAKACEKRLAAFLETGATAAAKMAVCRRLREIGTEACVPVLEKMLRDDETTDMARYALENIPGDRAERALLEALPEARGELRLGIISSLGRRGDTAALPALAGILGGKDKEAAVAAAEALGAIQSPKAAKILGRALDSASGPLKPAVVSSLLRCAEECLHAGKREAAAGIYGRLAGADIPRPLRIAALKGKMAASSREEARRMVLDALAGGSPEEIEAGVGMVRSLFGEEDLPRLCSLVSRLPARAKVQMLSVLATYGSPAVLPAAEQALESPEPEVRTAALGVMGEVGGASSVRTLAVHAATAGGKEKETARESLAVLGGEGVDRTILLELARQVEPGVRQELIRAVGRRGMEEGKGWLLALARDADAGISEEARRSLREIASPGDIPRLLMLLREGKSEGERMEVAEIIAAAAGSPPERRPVREVMDALLEERDSGVRKALLRALGKIGDDRSLGLLRSFLAEDDPGIRDAAVRALADWPSASAAEDLFQVALAAETPVHRVLSLRAYIRMLGAQTYRAPERVVADLEKILPLARPEEKKLVLGVLPSFASREALDMAETLAREKEVEEEARSAVEKIKEKLGKE